MWERVYASTRICVVSGCWWKHMSCFVYNQVYEHVFWAIVAVLMCKFDLFMGGCLYLKVFCMQACSSACLWVSVDLHVKLSICLLAWLCIHTQWEGMYWSGRSPGCLQHFWVLWGALTFNTSMAWNYGKSNCITLGPLGYSNLGTPPRSLQPAPQAHRDSSHTTDNVQHTG